MSFIQVRGGRPLRGTLAVQGSKNAALPLLAATLCTGKRCTLRGCPDISDVHTAIEILKALGCAATFDRSGATIDAGSLCCAALPPEPAGKMRASVSFLGALVCACGEASVPLPGGCVLGARPLDLHLSGLEALGATIDVDGSTIRCRGPLRGGTVILRYPSVGATENLLLAGCGAQGPVTILGAAREPEIEDLAGFLNRCGADIRGAGTGHIRILRGPDRGADYRVMPDRMAAASWLCAAAAAGGEIRLTGIRPDTLAPVLTALQAAGCSVQTTDSRIWLSAGPLQAIAPVVTGPYPDFPTDAQAPLMAALLRARGVTVFCETVFENRYRHVPALRALGADIRVSGRVASVRGVSRLRGAEMEATDLRGGMAMLIAALSAEGVSRIMDAQHLSRGYEQLCEGCRRLGADVTQFT